MAILLVLRKETMSVISSIFAPLLPPANEVCEGYVFTGVCLSTPGGVHGFIRGHAWFYLGGMRGFIRGHAWFYLGACMVLFGGHVWFYSGCAWFYSGVCVVLFGGHAWFYLGGHAWFFQFFQIQSDTVNERAVRILLECILV